MVEYLQHNYNEDDLMKATVTVDFAEDRTPMTVVTRPEVNESNPWWETAALMEGVGVMAALLIEQGSDAQEVQKNLHAYLDEVLARATVGKTWGEA